MLYMPGSNPRAMEKARSLACDGVILDLEDSVPPAKKAEAREEIRAAVEAGGWGHREVIVRINPLSSAWGEADLATVAACGPDGVLLPKLEGPDDIAAGERALAAADGPGAEQTALWSMMETPRAVLAAQPIAAASRRLAGLVLGGEDLALAMHTASPAEDRTPFTTAAGLILLAARAHGRVVLDGVYPKLEDGQGFERDCAEAARLGFDGKTLIHPRQIEAANTVFRPDEAAVARARRIQEAWRQAEADGAGIAVLDGEMIERLHAEEAERRIALHEAIAARTG